MGSSHSRSLGDWDRDKEGGEDAWKGGDVLDGSEESKGGSVGFLRNGGKFTYTGESSSSTCNAQTANVNAGQH